MRHLTWLFLLGLPAALNAAEPWQTPLSRMPLPASVKLLDRTNCVPVMLNAFQSNHVVKALIFMPGATDEFFMFRRASAVLTNNPASLLEAVTALTNQTLIRATFRPPFLLLHTEEDPLEPLVTIKDPATAAKLRKARFAPRVVYFDRDWDSLVFNLERTYGVWFRPGLHSRDSWHFYRHSFAAWNLDGWEALEAICFAGKSRFTVEHRKVVFEPDNRVLAIPTLDHFPK
jgi:hypothetical protein